MRGKKVARKRVKKESETTAADVLFLFLPMALETMAALGKAHERETQARIDLMTALAALAQRTK